MALTTGTRLGPYEIGSLLGVGGMSEVYRARDTRLDGTVAVKVLLPHAASDPRVPRTGAPDTDTEADTWRMSSSA